jgi:hypothetical protein
VLPTPLVDSTVTSASILRIDDNANDIELTLEALNEVPLPSQIDAARTGQQALDHVFGRGLWGRPRTPSPARPRRRGAGVSPR